MTTTALAEKKAAPATIRSLIESDNFKQQVAKALPKHLTADRFIRVAVTAMTKTPLLAQCEQASFFNALLTLSQLGLEPDGRRAHLIPFRNNAKGTVEVQLIVDYKGLVELVMNTGNVSNIHADTICENDEFIYDKGEIKAHKIDFRKARGNPYAAYAIIRFKDNTEKAEVMTFQEIESVRRRSKAGNSGPWVTDWSEMAKKTVFRRASKWVKLSPEQKDIIENDDDQFDFGKETGISSAQMLSERMKGMKAIETQVTAESTQEDTQAQPDPSESRIQCYLDMLNASQDIKGLDAAWQEIQDAMTACTLMPSEEEAQQLANCKSSRIAILFSISREDKEKEPAKRK